MSNNNEVSTEVQTSDATPDSGEVTTKQEINPGNIRRSTTNNILKAAENATGMQFSSVEEMMGMLAQAAQALNKPQAVVEQPATEQPATKRITNTDLHEKYEELRREMVVKEQRLRERELDTSIRTALGDRFDTEFADYTIDKIKSQLVEQDGDYIVVNSKQQQRYTSEGRPMAVRDLVEELARNNPKLLKQAAVAQGGSGLRPQGGAFESVPGDNEFVPDYTKDPAAFNAWASRRGLGRNAGLKNVTASVYNSTATKKIF